MKRAVLLAFALLALMLTACGGETKTVTEEATPPPAEEPQDEPAPEEEPAPEDPAEEPSGGSITVPNVVGKDHQLAQDTMQSAGLYSLEEKDATGQGRLLIYDRNWTVVKQDPPAGTKVSEDTTITLSAKKDGE